VNDYTVHFTYYNEEKGRFTERAYTLNAEDQFKARSTAWKHFNTDNRMKAASYIKQCGVT